MNNEIEKLFEELPARTTPDVERLFVRKKEGGVTQKLRNLMVGEIVEITGYKQSNVPSIGRNLGYKLTTASKEGKLYVKRVA